MRGRNRFQILAIILAAHRIDAHPDGLPMFLVQEFHRQRARLGPVARGHRIFQIEDQRIGGR